MIAKYRYQAYIWMAAGSILGFLLGHRLLTGIELPHKLVGAVVLMMTVIVGFLIGRLGAMVCANLLERRMLNFLYRDRNPEKFIVFYEKGLRLGRPDLAEYYTTANHLANAYAMEGNFEKAVSLLESLNTDSLKLHQLGIQALLSNSLTNWYLWNGQKGSAQEQLADLEELVDIAKRRQPAVANNLRNNIALFEQHLLILDHQPFDQELLEEILSHTGNPVFRQPTAYLLGTALLSSNLDRGREILDELAREPGAFWFSAQARLRLAELDQR